MEKQRIWSTELMGASGDFRRIFSVNDDAEEATVTELGRMSLDVISLEKAQCVSTRCHTRLSQQGIGRL